MNTSELMGFLFKFSDWFMKLAYINILWILFSSFGLFIIGFFPATFAMFSVIRLLLTNKEEASIFKSFWFFYTGDFLKSNIIGWTVTSILAMLYLDLNIIKASSIDFLQLLYYPIIILAFLFSLTVLYVIPTYIHYDLKIVQVFKNSFMIMILNPLNTFTMISSVLLIVLISIFLPVIILFFSGSVLAVLITIAALRSYKKLEDKKEIIRFNG